MGIPFDPTPVVFVAPRNVTPTGVVVAINRRGTIRRFRVLQLSGELEGFTYRLYSRYEAMRAVLVAAYTTGRHAYTSGALPAPPTHVGYNADTATVEGSSLDLDWSDDLAPLYAITPLRTVTGTHAEDDPTGYGLEIFYANNDFADPSRRELKSTNQLGLLYLVLTPAGGESSESSDLKHFGIDLCVDEPTNL